MTNVHANCTVCKLYNVFYIKFIINTYSFPMISSVSSTYRERLQSLYIKTSINNYIAIEQL